MTPCSLVNIYRHFRGAGEYTNEDRRFYEQTFLARREIADVRLAISKVAQFRLSSVRIPILFVFSLLLLALRVFVAFPPPTDEGLCRIRPSKSPGFYA